MELLDLKEMYEKVPEQINEVRQKLKKIQVVMEIINEQEHLNVIVKSKNLQMSRDKEELTRVTTDPWQNDVDRKMLREDRQR